MARWVWLGLAAIVVVALAGVFAVSWWAFGQDTAVAIATIAAVPLAVAVAVAPSVWARFRRQTNPSELNPALIVSAMSEDSSKTGLHYETRREDSRLIIEPRDSYLDLIRQSGELTPQHFWSTPWARSFEWPTLDVKLANNTSQTMLFHEAAFIVAQSRPDLRPIPVFRDGYKTRLLLLNLGWGPMADSVLRFRLAPSDGAPAVTQEFELHIDKWDKGHAEVPLGRFCASAGVDLEMLERLRVMGGDGRGYYLTAESGLGELVPADEGLFAGRRWLDISEYEALKQRAFGPFIDGFVVLRGTLEYTQIEIDGSRTRHANPFRAHVSFGGPRSGAPLPPTWTYQVRLRSDGRGYSVRIPISQTVANGEADRFLFKIAADRSSLHDFTLRLAYNDGLTLTSKPISLELFVSTLDARLASRKERDEAPRPGFGFSSDGPDAVF